MTTYVNFCWGLGQVIGIGVIKSMLPRDDQWSYRIPYALQWMWPVPLLIGILLAPESPWWLVRKGRIDDAKKALLRLTSLDRETDFDADETIAMMVHTTALEEKITSGASYLDCFRGTDLRRTEIVCMAWAIQNLSGNAFSGYSTYFLEQAGLDPSKAYDFALGQYGINMGGVLGAWFLMSLGLGRRTLYLGGLCGLCTMLMIMGFLGLVPAEHRDKGALATGAMMIVWALFYQLTVGTVCYSLVAELSTRRLQIKTVVLGRNLYNIVGIVCSVLSPYMLNPGAWNWKNYTGFFWGGICFLCIIYTYFRFVPPLNIPISLLTNATGYQNQAVVVLRNSTYCSRKASVRENLLAQVSTSLKRHMLKIQKYSIGTKRRLNRRRIILPPSCNDVTFNEDISS